MLVHHIACWNFIYVRLPWAAINEDGAVLKSPNITSNCWNLDLPDWSLYYHQPDNFTSERLDLDFDISTVIPLNPIIDRLDFPGRNPIDVKWDIIIMIDSWEPSAIITYHRQRHRSPSGLNFPQFQ